MKKQNLTIPAITLLLALAPLSLKSAEGVTSKTIDVQTTDDSLKINTVSARITEVRELDFSSLTPSQRDSLKEELTLAKANLKTYAKSSDDSRGNGGIYISVGGLIIIILLLIILL